MHVEARTHVQADPDIVFALYADVERWHTWDPDTAAASIDGPFADGTRGRLRPTRGREVPMELEQVVPGRSFTAVSRLPGFTMRFLHLLRAVPEGTEVLHRVEFSGWLAPVLGRVVGGPLREGLPRTLASLKRLAESREETAPMALDPTA